MTPKPLDTGGVEGLAAELEALVEKWREKAADIRLDGHITNTYFTCGVELGSILAATTEKPTDSMGGETDKENGAADEGGADQCLR